MKKLWERSSLACDSTQLPPPLRQALNRTIKELDEPLDEINCIKTQSTQVKSGFLSGKKKVLTTVLILSPRWLFEIIDDGNEKDPFVVVFYLDKMEISDTTMQLAAKMNLEDFGVDVLATIRGQVKRAGVFLGLENNAISAQFVQSLKDAVKKLN